MRSFRSTALLALPLLALSTFAVPARADVKAGVDAWQAGNYPAAVAEWRPLAIAGDADAQFNLGQAYKLGRGVLADLAQAEAWYRRAAKQGHLQAEDNLGLVLFTANRREEAMPYIVKSAARGEPRAQYVLGTAHFNGDLAERDWSRAYALTKRASDAGLSVASARLVQLDSLIPLDQRQRGLAMIPDMERSEQRERLAAVSAGAPSAPEPARSSPIKAASLPASAPGTSYSAPPVIPAPKPTPVNKPSASSPAAAAAATAAAEAAAEAMAATGQPGTTYAAPPEATKPTPKPVNDDLIAVAESPASARVDRSVASPWRAQLGAFGIEANARNLWASLKKKHPEFADREPHLVKSGKLTRLQVGGFPNKGAAENFCAALRKDGQACLVVDK